MNRPVSGLEMGFHFLERAGCDTGFVRDVARVMEYEAAFDLYGNDRHAITRDAA